MGNSWQANVGLRRNKATIQAFSSSGDPNEAKGGEAKVRHQRHLAVGLT